MPPATTSACLLTTTRAQRVASFVRRPRAVSPEARVAEVAEVLRAAPQGAVPVVEQGRLVGLVTAAALAAPLLDASDEPARAEIRRSPIARWMETPGPSAAPEWTVDTLLATLEAIGKELLPVSLADGTYLGLVSRADLLDELRRPVAPPLIGGMATPIGVYLHAGGVAAGAGNLALLLTGACLFAAQAGLYLTLSQIERGLTASIVDLSLPGLALGWPLRTALAGLLTSLLYASLFLLLVRLSPLAGYHAAEHQVVHAVERGEPLLVETVRAMPRVHPRCGTNFVAAAALLGAGSLLAPLLGSWGYLLSGIAALLYWRDAGTWLQQHLTTRPATDAQIASGIRAARDLLARYEAAPHRTPALPQRLWRTGLLQIAGGFALGGAFLWLIARAIPPLDAVLTPYLRALLTL